MPMICFDLEGPLSPQDNAYEVMRHVNGGAVFEALSNYDDILALEEKKGYEPGDTLKLIVPFLVYYGIKDRDIRTVSEKAALIKGMKELIEWLKAGNVDVRVISTSYQQHAYTIGSRLGIPKGDIASTKLNLNEISFETNIIESLKLVEEKILSSGLSHETTSLLNDIYFKSGLFDKIGVSVIGGQRKVDALKRFASSKGLGLSKIAAIGDSITDYKMLKEVRNGGGIAIAFNANQYCLPYADIAVATMDGRALKPLLKAFKKGGRKRALIKADELEKHPENLDKEGLGFLLDSADPPIYNLLDSDIKQLENVLEIHRVMRGKVRGEAGKLG